MSISAYSLNNKIMVNFRVRFRVMDKIRVRVTVRVWIVWYIDAQMAARFDGRQWARLHAAFAYFYS